MTIDINATELQVAKEIVTKGLLKSAESLSFFMKEKILLDDMDYSFDEPSPKAEFTNKEGHPVYLLLTEIIGELNGVCCLIFTEEEAEKIRDTALPAEIKNNPEIMSEMSDGILLEIDNIISASVITQFSNILNHKIYGGVPQIKKLTNSAINEFIKEKLEKEMLVINFNTRFISPILNFSPQFIWFFDKTFAESIKKFASKENIIS